MDNPKKIGGGNKPQDYIPAGNGKKSGEYTTSSNNTNVYLDECHKSRSYGKHNFCNSTLVQKVENHFSILEKSSVPKNNLPNSVTKKIVNDYVVTERYYDSEGNPYLDIDYTCHGNPKTHPVVPHIHRWTKNDSGIYTRGKWEEFL